MKIALLLSASLMPWNWGTLCAQRVTAQLGFGGSIPVERNADFVHSGLAFVAGLGYHWSGRQGVLLQYYSTGLPFHDSILNQLGFLHPQSNLYSITANYQLEFRESKTLHPYVIGGGGWYRRVTTITRPELVGEIACSPGLNWWGYACTGGFVPLDKIVAASTSDAVGFNGGAGISGRFKKDGLLHWYVEIRYHYAPHSGVPTQTIPLVAGLTF